MRMNLATLCAALACLALLGAPAQAASPDTAPLKVASRTVAHRSLPGYPHLNSAAALVIDQLDGGAVYEKNSELPMPIASITKLMTAMVVLDAGQSLDEPLTISSADIDRLRNSSSRLLPGTTLSRREMLHLALMSSENRAASTLARYYPGGKPACVEAMNRKARFLGMHRSRFADPTGLDGRNSASAEDLAAMVRGAYRYALIKQFTTARSTHVSAWRHASLEYRNTNILVKNPAWHIGLSKTGYINEAGRCLVMQARIAERPMIIVLLNAQGKYSGVGDANRIKKWLEGIGYAGTGSTRRVAMGTGESG